MFKKVGILFIICLFLGSLAPSLALAATNSNFDADLQEYLKRATDTRGFEVTESELNESLAQYEATIEDFETVAELDDFLGEVIKADGSNLQAIYDEYNDENPGYQLDKAKLEATLQKNGEELSDYVFVDDLQEAIYYYLGTPQEADFDKKLEELLNKYSKIRDFTVTKEHVEKALDVYGYQLVDFGTVADLEDFLGEVIKADGSNLDYFQDMYNLDQKTLLQGLSDNGKTLADYVFLDNLEYDLLEMGVISDDWNLEEPLGILMDDYGLDEDELNRLVDHLDSISGKFSDSDTMDQLQGLAIRMSQFPSFDTLTELTAEEIAELTSIYNEILNIFELKAEYVLISGEGSKPLSLADVLALTNITNAKLQINLYNLSGDFLADLIITGEQVDSNAINNAGGEISNTVQEVEEKTTSPATNKEVKSTSNVVAKQVNGTEKKVVKSTTVKTATGAKLPKTASNFLANSTVGASMLLMGVVMYRKLRKSL